MSRSIPQGGRSAGIFQSAVLGTRGGFGGLRGWRARWRSCEPLRLSGRVLARGGRRDWRGCWARNRAATQWMSFAQFAPLTASELSAARALTGQLPPRPRRSCRSPEARAGAAFSLRAAKPISGHWFKTLAGCCSRLSSCWRTPGRDKQVRPCVKSNGWRMEAPPAPRALFNLGAAQRPGVPSSCSKGRVRQRRPRRASRSGLQRLRRRGDGPAKLTFRRCAGAT